jgi:hypothetical protein
MEVDQFWLAEVLIFPSRADGTEKLEPIYRMIGAPAPERDEPS